jgi:hypothetical protein
MAVLDNLVEVKAPFNPTQATEHVANTLRAYGLHHTVGDKYAAGWTVDAFAKCGIRYEHSTRDRSSLYLDCLPLFTSGRAKLLDNKRLVTQFAGLERRTTPIGKDRVDHGPGGHDDLANSASGCSCCVRLFPLLSMIGRRSSQQRADDVPCNGRNDGVDHQHERDQYGDFDVA